MTPLELVRDAMNTEFRTGAGEVIDLKFLPGLSEDEVAAFEAKLPCKLSTEIRELLRHSCGFDNFLISVNFTGVEFNFDSVFPHGLPIAHDGSGNFWAVDLLPNSTSFGPIYFACHDPAIILFQSPSLEHFLIETFKLFIPPIKSLIDDVHEDRFFDVWAKNPQVLTHAECVASSDPQLSAFAKELDASFQIIDLRNAPVGFGFSWGRYGANTVIRRFGMEPIFAYQKKSGFLKRLFQL